MDNEILIEAAKKWAYNAFVNLGILGGFVYLIRTVFGI